MSNAHPDQYSELAAVRRNILKRRTIKPPFMRDEPVPKAVIEDVLEQASWAPTHGQTEPWRFNIYGPETRVELGAALKKLYEHELPAAQQKPGKADKLAKMVALAPVVMIVWMQRQELRKISEFDELLAVGCAVQNLHLAATAHGLGGFWSTPPVIHLQATREWLGIGEEDRCLGLFYLGYPKDEQWPEGLRQPIGEKTQWIESLSPSAADHPNG